ncbi:TIGR03758 family integrating conjugative element protein [Methylomonas sp. MgM2]
MTNTQLSAFSHATGGAVPGHLVLAIAGVLAVIYLIWLAWLAHAQLVAWQTGQAVFYDLLLTILRGGVIALLLGFLVR